MRLHPMYDITPCNIDRSSDVTAKSGAVGARQASLMAVRCSLAASAAWIKGKTVSGG